MLKKWGIILAGTLMYGTLYGQKVEFTTLGNPKAVVYDLEYSKDGSKLATTEGNLIKIWDIEQQQLLKTLTGHDATVLALAYSTNNQLVSGSKDGNLVIWNATAGTPEKRLVAHQGPINAIAISPDGSLIATAGADKHVKVWSMATGAEEVVFTGHTADVTTVAFSKSGEYLISGGGDKLLKVWHLKDKSLFKNLQGHKNWIRSIAVHPDGTRIASGSDDKSILIWNLPDAEAISPIEVFRKLHKNWVTSVDYQDDGNYFISIGHDNNLTISSSDSPRNSFYVKYRNPLINHVGHQYTWKASFQPGSYRIAVATIGKGVLLTNYFQKIYEIPHSLKITEVENQRYNEPKYEYNVRKSKVKIKGEVSRPKMVSKIILNHGKESIEVEVKRNGKFTVIADLAVNGSDLDFVILDKDEQINQSAYPIKINH